jgi:hypothetical protein
MASRAVMDWKSPNDFADLKVGLEFTTAAFYFYKLSIRF